MIKTKPNKVVGSVIKLPRNQAKPNKVVGSIIKQNFKMSSIIFFNDQSPAPLIAITISKAYVTIWMLQNSISLAFLNAYKITLSLASYD